jgi:hypothetical protein
MALSRLLAAAPFLILLVVALALLGMAVGFHSPAAAGRLGPGAWPGMVAGLLAVLAGAKALALARGQELDPSRSRFAEEEDAQAAPLQPWRAIAALAAFGVYCLTLGTLGFPLATALLLGAFLFVAGYRRPVPLLVTSVAGSVALFLLFRTVVYVSLPLGLGPFQYLSLGLLRLLGAS